MKRVSDLKLITTFALLTFLLTAAVILAWEQFLLPPFYSWVDARYPGEAHVRTRWNIQQRVEHVFISIMVDVVVVTLLLYIVRGQQHRLVESEGRYRALFEHAGDGIGIITAAERRFVEVNHQFACIFGMESSELVGQDLKHLRCESAGGLNTNAIEELIDSAPSGERELIVRTGGQNELPALVSFDTLDLGGQRLVILIVRDLSERKRLAREKEAIQVQLLQSSKLASVGELSAGIAHEINNPVNGIINLAQLLKDEETALTAEGRRMLDGIIEEGERITKIVRDLLTFARRDAPELANVNIGETISTSVALFGRQLHNNAISVEVRVDDDLPPVRADGSRLRQVVVNMISNAHYALRAKAAGDRVFRISARTIKKASRRFVLLEFFDNGVGIRQQDVEKIFDPFFTTRRDDGGTGLGLSVSFGIVRECGGTLSVESVEQGYTRFSVELPAAR